MVRKNDNFIGLKPILSKPRKQSIIGLDVETYDHNQKFLCGSAYSKGKHLFFKDKKEFLDSFFKKHFNHEFKFYDSLIFCTNLKFDFFSIFEKRIAFNYFKIIERASSLIMCLSYLDLKNKKFIHPDDYKKLYREAKKKKKEKEINQNYRKITFADSLNIVRMSVKEMGKIIGLEKIELPHEKLGMIPQSEKEWLEMKEYNIRDSEITCKFIDWFQDVLNNLGGNMKVTIASIALDFFRRKHLHVWIEQSSRQCLELEFKGYYGGRTEAFQRGLFTNLRTFDITSLYPAMMFKYEFPFPKGEYKKKITESELFSFDGVCYAELYCPENINIPLLPVRTDKLRFPTGYIKGYYDFFSLRKAINEGYELQKLGEGSIYKNKFTPFKGFVSDLFSMKEKYTLEKNPMALVCKLLLNSFYGKLATKIDNKEILKPFDKITPNEFSECSIIPYHDGLYRVITTEKAEIPKYVHPILSLYVTAYGRFYMYQKMKQIGFNHVSYIDTDGIKTDRVIEASGELGEFKLEDQYKEMLIIKPKMYSYISLKDKVKVRIKGCKEKNLDGVYVMSHFDLKDSVQNFKQVHVKFKNFRSLRSAFTSKSYVNEIIEVQKIFDLEDNKRVWEKEFITLEPQKSKPVHYEEKVYSKT